MTEPKMTIDLPFSPQDLRNGTYSTPFRCCHCGTDALPDNMKPCDCVTGVGYRIVGGKIEHVVFERETTPLIDAILRDVAELPDRSSPADQPEMMLVSAEELRLILASRLGEE